MGPVCPTKGGVVGMGSVCPTKGGVVGRYGLSVPN